MNSVEARQILGIKDDLITPERVKESYRRAAFHAHPDRGGTVQEFLKIQAAYEFLIGNQGGSAWGETTLELEKRLNEIGRAFDRLKTDFGPVFGEQFDGMADHMAVSMQSLDSTRRIERDWSGSVQTIWMEFQLTVHEHISSKVEGISQAFVAHHPFCDRHVQESITRKKHNHNSSNFGY
jgi:DnaJ-class molecular chaperone